MVKCLKLTDNFIMFLLYLLCKYAIWAFGDKCLWEGGLCYEFAVTRNQVCLLFEYFGNFHVFCASRPIWPLVDSYRGYLRFVYLIMCIYYLIANCIMHLFICNPSHSS